MAVVCSGLLPGLALLVSFSVLPLQEQLVQALHGDWPELSEDVVLKRHGQGSSHWVTVDENMTLKEILLQPNHIVPGVPLFWVLAQGTTYRDRFLSEELKRF